jgi:hypothetical protein
MFKAILDVLNGHKMNTGTIITIAAFLMQQYLSVEHDQAVSIATNVMMGIGGITMLWGYIHKLIKSSQVKKV